MKRYLKLKNKRRSYVSYLLLIPTLLLLIIIIVLPALRTVYMSFYRVTFGLPEQYVGLINFKEIFNDQIFKLALIHTLMFTFATVIGQILLALVAGLIMSTEFPLQKVFVSIIIMPYAVSVVVAIIIWKYMLQPDVGIINYLLHTVLNLKQIEWASNPKSAWAVIISIEIWMTTPFSFLIIYSALLGVPKELKESACIDGAGHLKRFRYITLPLITPAIMVAAIFRFIFVFRSFDTVWILTQGGPLHTTELLSTLLYKQAFTFWEFGPASAISLIMAIITFVITVYYLRIMFKKMFIE